MPSSSILGPGDARWDSDFDFDDDAWDSPLRGRAVPVPVGSKGLPIVRSMRRKAKDDPDERTVRLTLRATGASIKFLVVSSLDSEEIEMEVNVPLGGARSISMSCDRFLVTADHSTLVAPAVPLVAADAVAHYRIDDKANAPSVWSLSRVVIATGVEQVVTQPPFADGLIVLCVAGQAGTLTFYEGDVVTPAQVRAVLPVAGPQQGVIPSPDLGAMTLTAAAGTVWTLNWRCVG